MGPLHQLLHKIFYTNKSNNNNLFCLKPQMTLLFLQVIVASTWKKVFGELTNGGCHLCFVISNKLFMFTNSCIIAKSIVNKKRVYSKVRKLFFISFLPSIMNNHTNSLQSFFLKTLSFNALSFFSHIKSLKV